MSAVDMSIGRGFLPPVDPVTNLIDIYPPFASIVKFAERLPEFIKTRRVAEHLHHIESLPCLDPAQYELPVLIRSYAVIMMIVHAYILEMGDNQNADSPVTLPRKIAHWVEYTAQSIGRLPTQTYETYVLQNYRLLKPSHGFHLENIEPLLTFTGTIGEAWFIKMHIYAEYRAAKWMQISEKINKILVKQAKIDTVQLTADLQTIADDLHDFNTDYFIQMKKNLSTREFFHNVRPYIKTWRPGIIYTGSDKYGANIMRWRGASGAQSSFIPAMDYLLGIQIEQQQTMKDMLNYMPPEHRAFLHSLQNSPLRNLVLELGDSDLNAAYNNLIRSCAEFRKKHYHLMALPYLINHVIDTYSHKIGVKITEKIDTPIAPYISIFIRRLMGSFFSKPKNLSKDAPEDFLKIFNELKAEYSKYTTDTENSVDFKSILGIILEQLKCSTTNTLGTGGEDFRFFLPKNCCDTENSLL